MMIGATTVAFLVATNLTLLLQAPEYWLTLLVTQDATLDIIDG
jgi:hypothetical protein